MFSKLRAPTASLLAMSRLGRARAVPVTFSLYSGPSRWMSTNPTEEVKKPSSEVVKMDYDDYDEYYEPKTAKEKVAWYGRLFAMVAFLGIGSGLAGYTFYNLLPSRMHPQSLVSEVFDKIRIMHEIQSMAGHDIRAFGRDTGRSEGRRHHVDSHEYKAEDGSKRLRVRFNIKGDKSQLVVYAEVSDRMNSGEFVYIIVQSVRNGRVFTVVDNRDTLALGTPSGEGDSAINNFFFGGK